MATYAFANGRTKVASFGESWQVGFLGTWVSGDSWTLSIASTDGNITVGRGNLTGSDLYASCCFTFRNRVYVTNRSQFNFSENGDPTLWEEQDPGAGLIEYLSNFGSQDSLYALSQLQGRLAVLAGRSIQLWTVDADPNNFSLVQTLDNIGTYDPLSVQNIGDYDVIFLDPTGFRSLRSREVTLNAFVDDVGSPVDSFVQASLASYVQGYACGIVEPKTKNYWCFINDTIYVLSRHFGSKISAWSQFSPTGSDGVAFIPQKFVVYNGQVYCRGANRGLYLYGGANNKTYDAYSPVSAQIPWMDDKQPETLKQIQGMNFVLQGKWKIQASTDPIGQVTNTIPIYEGGDPANPSSKDSTYDTGRIPFEAHCTHFTLIATSENTSTSVPAILSSMAVHYNKAEVD